MGEPHIPVPRNPHHSALLTQSVYKLSQPKSLSVMLCSKVSNTNTFKCVQRKEVEDMIFLNCIFSLGNIINIFD